MVIQPLSTRLIKPNFCFDLSYRRSTTVSLETRNPFIRTCRNKGLEELEDDWGGVARALFLVENIVPQDFGLEITFSLRVLSFQIPALPYRAGRERKVGPQTPLWQIPATGTGLVLWLLWSLMNKFIKVKRETFCQVSLLMLFCFVCLFFQDFPTNFIRKRNGKTWNNGDQNDAKPYLFWMWCLLRSPSLLFLKSLVIIFN